MYTRLESTNASEDEDLLLASMAGDEDAVKSYLTSGRERYVVDEYDRNALVIALLNGHEKVVKLLLKHGFDARAKGGQDALMKASEMGHDTIVKLLLDHCSDINDYGIGGVSALMLASQGGHNKTVELLLKKGSNINAVNKYGLTALAEASEKGHDETVKLLLDYGSDINMANNAGVSALMRASSNGHTKTVQLLLDRGSDVNAQDKQDLTALMLVSKQGRDKIVKLLLDRGSRVNAKDNDGETALMKASLFGHETTVKLLLDCGSDIDAVDNNGETALMKASQTLKVEVAALLLKEGSNLNHVNNRGHNSLIIASQKDSFIAWKLRGLLLNDREKLNLRNKYGHNALMIAALNGNTSLLSVLPMLTYDLNATDNNGNTALMLASRKGHYSSVTKLLLNQNIDIQITNNFGETALMQASKNGHYKTVTLLLKNEAKANIVDENGWNALLIASLYGQETVIEMFLRNKNIMFTVQEKDGISCSATLDDECLHTDFVQDTTTQILLESARYLNKWWNQIVEITKSRLDILRSSSSFNSKIIDAVFDLCKKTNVPVTNHNETVTEEQRTYECSNTIHAVILIHLFSIYFDIMIAELYQKYGLSVQQPPPELKLFINALNVHLQKLRTFVFQTKRIEYNQNNCICLLRNLLEGFAKQITQAHDQMTSPVGYKMYEEEIWSSIFGLKKEFGEKLHEVSAEGKEHQTESYFLKCFIQNEVDDDIDLGREAYVDAINLAEKLKQIGFLDDTASFIANNIPTNLVERQTILFWAFRYIDNIFQYHPMITDCPRYPYNTELTDTCFQWDVSAEYRDDDDGDDTVPIHMINVSSRQLDFAADEELSCPPNKRLLYHGTTHQGACSILKHGIVLSSGSKCQDFSHGDGFYLYFDPLKAKTCGQALTLTHSAIIAFAVDVETLDPVQNNGLDLTNNKSLWLKVVQNCRSGYFDKKLKHELLNGCVFVIGPECTRPASFLTQDTDDGSLLGDVQFCVRDEDYAIKFGTLKNIAFVIFY